jgi:hypothetical protein
MVVVALLLEHNTMIVAAVAVAVEALEKLAAVVDSVAERNTVGLVELVV